MPEVDVRSVEEASVWKAGIEAGRLVRRHDGSVAFRYLPAYLSGGGTAVAWTLPVSEEPVVASAGAVPPFFAGLLPEGARLTALVARVRTSVDDMLSLLLAVGEDTIGDVTVTPVGAEPSTWRPAVRVEDPSALDLGRLFDEVVASVGPTTALALPGVQEKVSAEVISFPARAGEAGEPVIIKLQPAAFPRLIENERFFLDVARSSRLAASPATLVRDAAGAAALLVRRFDRRRIGDQLVALPQEDACQVMGRFPGDKYRLETLDVITALADRCAAPVVARRDLLAQVALAYLIGNGDLHAKNLSIGWRPDLDGWAVTPAYDVLSTLPYGDPRMALPIEGRRDSLTRRRLLAVGRVLGVAERALEREVDPIVAAVADAADQVGEIGFDDRRSRDLAKALRYRCRQLSRDR